MGEQGFTELIEQPAWQGEADQLAELFAEELPEQHDLVVPAGTWASAGSFSSVGCFSGTASTGATASTASSVG